MDLSSSSKQLVRVIFRRGIGQIQKLTALKITKKFRQYHVCWNNWILKMINNFFTIY